MCEIGVLLLWIWLNKKACPSVRQSLATIPTTTKFVYQRKELDAAAMVAFVACGNEPTAGEAERSEDGVRGVFLRLRQNNSPTRRRR
jgi:hypothetical protein